MVSTVCCPVSGETKTQFLQRAFRFSVNKVFWMKDEDFSFKMQLLAGLQLEKQL